MTVEQDRAPDPLRPKVKTFQLSGFQGVEWEVVSKDPIPHAFESEQYTVVDRRESVVDPMFENYDADPTIVVVPFQSVEQQDEDVTDSSNEAVVDVSVQAQGEREASEHVLASADGTEVTNDVVASPESEVSHSPTDDVSTSEDALIEEVPSIVPDAPSEDGVQAEQQRLVAAAHQAGIDEGRALALREADEKLKALEQRYEAVFDDLSEQIRQGIEQVERRAVDFSLNVAKKLVGTSLEVNPEHIAAIVKEAIKSTGGATIKAVRVNPGDIEVLSKLKPETFGKERGESWSFEADETIRTGCVVETSSGEIDYDLDKAWERIRTTVHKVG